MGKKSRKHHRDLNWIPFDGFDDIYDEDMDIKDLSRDIYSTDWGGYSERVDRSSTRRKIERRSDMKKLYSELNDWEEFGSRESWHIH